MNVPELSRAARQLSRVDGLCHLSRQVNPGRRDNFSSDKHFGRLAGTTLDAASVTKCLG